jgi:hypothetical protein
MDSLPPVLLDVISTFRPLLRAEVFESFTYLLCGLLIGEAKHGTVRASVFAPAAYQPPRQAHCRAGQVPARSVLRHCGPLIPDGAAAVGQRPGRRASLCQRTVHPTVGGRPRPAVASARAGTAGVGGRSGHRQSSLSPVLGPPALYGLEGRTEWQQDVLVGRHRAVDPQQPGREIGVRFQLRCPPCMQR